MKILKNYLFSNKNLLKLLKTYSNQTNNNKFKSLFKPSQWLSNVQSKKPLFLKTFLVTSTFYLTFKGTKGYFNIIPQINAAAIIPNDNLSGRRQQFNFIADVVEKSAPAVVYIEIKDPRRVDFFTGKPLTLSNGSGFIIESNGLIVTNAHVVTNKPSTKVEVKLIDGRIFKGVVENLDLKSDLATVRIAASNLPIIHLGNSADIKPGEFVVAIGSPLSLSNTVTTGVVSTVQRGSAELGLTGKDMIYIQTDAAITFGNSGGPLVNLDGEAIGVNSMRVTPGISFAIPINYVKDFLERSKMPKKDAPKRLYVGITMLTLTPDLLHEFSRGNNDSLPHGFKGGVLVWKVMRDSPAHFGGLQQGDIVTHIDGKEIRDVKDVYAILKETDRKNLRMSIRRRGKDYQLNIQPEDLY